MPLLIQPSRLQFSQWVVISYCVVVNIMDILWAML